jgi:histone H2B
LKKKIKLKQKQYKRISIQKKINIMARKKSKGKKKTETETETKEAIPEKKVEKEEKVEKGQKVDEKKKKKKNTSAFHSYIHKIMKDVCPDNGISAKAVETANDFIVDLFDRLAQEAGYLARSNKRHTITDREIQAAVRLIIPGELAMHAVLEGQKAVTRFSKSIGKTEKVKEEKKEKSKKK